MVVNKVILLSALCLVSSVCFAWGANNPQTSFHESNNFDDLCSPAGIAKLVPAFRGQDGKFTVPDPVTDLSRFLQAYDGLRNVIDVALVQAKQSISLNTVGSKQYTHLSFDSNWIASEVGFEQNGDVIPDFTKSNFGDYGGASFIQNIVPVKGTNGVLYTIPKSGVFITTMPTVLSCVNVMMETSSHDSGTFVSPSYALGDKDGKAFLLVNGCQNTTTTTIVNGKKVMTPKASGYLGLQVSASYFHSSVKSK
jgi:hypothetical protein